MRDIVLSAIIAIGFGLLILGAISNSDLMLAIGLLIISSFSVVFYVVNAFSENEDGI